MIKYQNNYKIGYLTVIKTKYGLWYGYQIKAMVLKNMKNIKQVKGVCWKSSSSGVKNFGPMLRPMA